MLRSLLRNLGNEFNQFYIYLFNTRIKLLRFPATYDELQSNLTDDARMLYKSTFSFRGLAGDLSCDLRVVDNMGVTSVDQRLHQTDRIERKYSVTTNKYSR